MDEMNQKYIVVKDFFSEQEVNFFTTYSRISMMNARKFNHHCGACISEYGSVVFDSVLADKVKIINKITNLSLIPTYSFFRIYNKYSELKKHTDRPSCEVSVTVHINSDGTKWPFFIEGKEFNLKPGEAIIYLGQYPHWRDEFQGDWYSQLFLHYVNKNGKNTNWIYDKRRGLGLDKKEKYDFQIE